MFILAAVLAIIISILLIFIVLIQNPKGGVLSSTFGSMGNQILGANRSTDVIEKITWYLAGALLVVSILSIFVLPAGPSSKDVRPNSAVEEALKNNTTTAPVIPTTPQAPSGNNQAQPTQTAPPASGQQPASSAPANSGTPSQTPPPPAPTPNNGQ